jgi:crossover junction endodeoxyribonuclease RuvC
MNTIGIDPGLSGGIAIIGGGPMSSELALHPMPAVTIKGYRKNRHEIDEQAVVSLLTNARPCHVFLERVHAMPKQGVTSMFTFGAGWGLIRGILAGLGIPYELVSPQEWQKAMLAGQPKGSEFLVASRLWPNADFKATPRCKNPHEGLVDAVLLAEFGRRKLAGG